MGFYDNWFSKVDTDAHVHHGIITALVKENWNEEKKGMIKVEFFFGVQGMSQTEWVQVASPYTGNKTGMFFLPEVGSEVLVAFINGNRNEPIVIGSLWNAKTPLGDDYATEKNTIKTIKTKAGHEIRFDEEEEKGQITIQSAGKLQISLADEKKILKITNEDAKSGVTIDFEKGKVTVEAEKKIALSVGGTELIAIDDKSVKIKADTVQLEGGQTLALKGQSAKLEGNSVNFKSDAALEVKAGATLKLEGSAMAELKGGMVKIN